MPILNEDTYKTLLLQDEIFISRKQLIELCERSRWMLLTIANNSNEDYFFEATIKAFVQLVEMKEALLKLTDEQYLQKRKDFNTK